MGSKTRPDSCLDLQAYPSHARLDSRPDRAPQLWRYYQIDMLIQPNKTKAKLQQGLPVYGVISTSDDPQLAELFGIAGFDYYMLDAEHGLIDPVQAVNLIRACESTNMTPIVRIGPKDPKLVLQYLDAGMMGIMM